MTAPPALRAVRLRCEHLVEPLAIDEPLPHLSWELEGPGRNRRQRAWRVRASRPGTDDGDLWDSGWVASADPLAAWGGRALTSLARVSWRVGVRDEAGGETWSDPACFGMGLLRREDWTSDWIGAPVAPPGGLPSPDGPPADSRWAAHLYQHQYRRVAYLRRAFSTDRPVERAMLFATARGLARWFLDGAPVDDRLFAPGWTDYRRRIEVQAVDVTAKLSAGPHVIGAMLGEGWYSGHIGFRPKQRGAHYGIIPWCRAELHIWHADGNHDVVVTDASWRAGAGGVISSDLLMGELFDAREEQAGWAEVDFDDRHWPAAEIGPPSDALLVAERGPPVRVVERLRPQAIRAVAADRWLVDFGQNLAGRVRLAVDAPADGEIRLRHGEALDADGSLYTDNLRTARAEDRVVTGGRPLEFAPSFTVHGFRHVEVRGPLARLEPDDILAEAVMSDTPRTGWFRCSHAMVNRLYENILWGQRSNFLSVPTDCPQRDERLGWTGDAQIFAATAAFNMDVAGFLAKWLVDLVDAQRPDGLFPDVAPLILFENGGAPGWGDAGVIIPWTLWRMTGDRGFIDRFWEPMCRHVARVDADNPDGPRVRGCHFNFGDWLSAGEETPRALVATAYHARMHDLMARMAAASGRDAKAAAHRAAFGRARTIFADAFCRPDGLLMGDSQTGYLMALGFGLLEPAAQATAAARLCAKIEARGHRLTSGFLGVNLLLPVLSQIGRADLAMKLLLQDTFPSWGFTIRHGATTIWERWDSWTPEHGFKPGMNSFNHYAFGSVGEWLYRRLGGIDFDEAAPPLSLAVIAPEIGAAVAHGIDWCETRFDSRRGPVSVRWEAGDGQLRVDLSLPPGMEGLVRLPGRPEDVLAADGLELLPSSDTDLEARAGSGTWRVRLRWQTRG